MLSWSSVLILISIDPTDGGKPAAWWRVWGLPTVLRTPAVTEFLLWSVSLGATKDWWSHSGGQTLYLHVNEDEGAERRRVCRMGAFDRREPNEWWLNKTLWARWLSHLMLYFHSLFWYMVSFLSFLFQSLHPNCVTLCSICFRLFYCVGFFIIIIIFIPLTVVQYDYLVVTRIVPQLSRQQQYDSFSLNRWGSLRDLPLVPGCIGLQLISLEPSELTAFCLQTDSQLARFLQSSNSILGLWLDV